MAIIRQRGEVDRGACGRKGGRRRDGERRELGLGGGGWGGSTTTTTTKREDENKWREENRGEKGKAMKTEEMRGKEKKGKGKGGKEKSGEAVRKTRGVRGGSSWQQTDRIKRKERSLC